VRVSKELDDFRKTVMSQFEQANEGKVSLRASYNFKDFIDFNEFVEKKNTFRTSRPVKDEPLVRQNAVDIEIPKKKFFASNKIESDYSNFEEQEKRKVMDQKINTEVSKIEDKREEIHEPDNMILQTNNSEKNKGDHNKSTHHIEEILQKIDESEKKRRRN